MLWYCRFKWHPQTSAEALRKRILEQDDAGTNHPERVRGWYNLAGGGAGFMLIETEEPRELTDMLSHYQRRGELLDHPSHHLINKANRQDQLNVLL